MSLAAQRQACIDAMKAATNGPADQDAAVGAVVDAIIALIKNADINAAPPAGSLSNTGGPVLGTILGSLGGIS